VLLHLHHDRLRFVVLLELVIGESIGTVLDLLQIVTSFRDRDEACWEMAWARLQLGDTLSMERDLLSVGE